MKNIAYNTGKHLRKSQAPLQRTFQDSKCQINVRSACDKESEKDFGFSKIFQFRHIHPINNNKRSVVVVFHVAGDFQLE